MADSTVLFGFGFGLVLIGALLLVVAAVLVSVMRGKNGKTKTAGIVIIGPIPIIFGSDKKTVKTLLALSIVLTVTLIVGALIYYFLFSPR